MTGLAPFRRRAMSPQDLIRLIDEVYRDGIQAA
jgi:hypothetical protein